MKNEKRRLHIYKVCIYQNHCRCQNTHPTRPSQLHLRNVGRYPYKPSVRQYMCTLQQQQHHHHSLHFPNILFSFLFFPFSFLSFPFLFHSFPFPPSFSHFTYLSISSTSNLLHMTLDLHHRFHLYFRIRSRPRPSPRGDSTFV